MHEIIPISLPAAACQVFDSLALAREHSRIAREMGNFILTNHSELLQGKRYIRVSGATALANGCGYTVREVCGQRMEWSPGLTGWEVTCEIIDVQTGITIGRGTGIVTDDEKLWSTRPQFARRSMASTRAAGRALRLALGHLFVLLGDKVATVTREEMPDE
jgi:hypothetical protein